MALELSRQMFPVTADGAQQRWRPWKHLKNRNSLEMCALDLNRISTRQIIWRIFRWAARQPAGQPTDRRNESSTGRSERTDTIAQFHCHQTGSRNSLASPARAGCPISREEERSCCTSGLACATSTSSGGSSSARKMTHMMVGCSNQARFQPRLASDETHNDLRSWMLLLLIANKQRDESS